MSAQTPFLRAAAVALALGAPAAAGAQAINFAPVPTYFPDDRGIPGCMVEMRLAWPRPSDRTPFPCAVTCGPGGRAYEEGQDGAVSIHDICIVVGPSSTVDLGNGCTARTGPNAPGIPVFRIVYPRGHPECAKMSGDPHVRTMDGVRFDLQATGEFVGLEALDDDLEVQLRLEAPADTSRVSYATAVAARVGAHRLTIAARSADELRIDGEPFDLADGHVLPLKGPGAALLRDGNRYTLLWPDGSNLHVDLFGKYLNAYFLPARERDGRLAGLFGDADGDRADDFVARDGRRLDSPPDFDSLYGTFAESWRVADGESLFDYAAGESAATFHRPGVPAGPAALADLDDAARASAESACRSAGVFMPEALEECVIDVGFSGDESFIAAARAQQAGDELLGDIFRNWVNKDFFFPLGTLSFADRVVSWTPGNPAPDAETAVVERVLGPPDFQADRKTSYLSLGRGGSLVVEFTDNVLVDIPGPDLMVFEIGDPERSTVAISVDGETWLELGQADGRAPIDIAPVATPGARYRFVRLTEIHAPDAARPGKITPNAGPDLDAIGAIGSERPDSRRAGPR